MKDEYFIKRIPEQQKTKFIEKIKKEKFGILLASEGESFNLFAYKNSREIEKIKNSLNEAPMNYQRFYRRHKLWNRFFILMNQKAE